MEFEYSVGPGFIGVDFPFTNTKDRNQGYIYGRFFNFFLQSDNGIGIGISPLALHVGIDNIDNYYFTFANLSVSYNILSIFYPGDKDFILGPFTSISAVKHIQPDYFKFQAGLLFMIRYADYDISSLFCRDIFFAELSYFYSKDNKRGVNVCLGIDVISALGYIGMTKQDDYEEAKKNYPAN